MTLINIKNSANGVCEGKIIFPQKLVIIIGFKNWEMDPLKPVF